MADPLSKSVPSDQKAIELLEQLIEAGEYSWFHTSYWLFLEASPLASSSVMTWSSRNWRPKHFVSVSGYIASFTRQGYQNEQSNLVWLVDRLVLCGFLCRSSFYDWPVPGKATAFKIRQSQAYRWHALVPWISTWTALRRAEGRCNPLHKGKTFHGHNPTDAGW